MPDSKTPTAGAIRYASLIDYHAAYRKKHKARINAHAKAVYEADPDRVKASNNASYKKNKDRWRATRKRYYATNRDEIIRKAREWYVRNREAALSKASAYSKLHPHLVVIRRDRRRARLMHRDERFSGALAADIKRIKALVWVNCYYCRGRIRGKDAHIDHVIPLAKGGDHSPGNICASCKTCNLRKSVKLPDKLPFLGQPVLGL